jgi:hypothetical protein
LGELDVWMKIIEQDQAWNIKLAVGSLDRVQPGPSGAGGVGTSLQCFGSEQMSSSCILKEKTDSFASFLFLPLGCSVRNLVSGVLLTMESWSAHVVDLGKELCFQDSPGEAPLHPSFLLAGV